MTHHGLSQRQLEILVHILAPFADKIEKAALFGSRATGKYKPHSDIDLVLYGDISESEEERIFTLFDSSTMSVKVDVHVYQNIQYSPLKEHIDRVNRTLFTQEQIKSLSTPPMISKRGGV